MFNGLTKQYRRFSELGELYLNDLNDVSRYISVVVAPTSGVAGLEYDSAPSSKSHDGCTAKLALYEI